MSNEKKLQFQVCGLSLKHFLPFFLIVMLVTYTGMMPTVKLAEGADRNQLHCHLCFPDVCRRHLLLAG